MSRILKFCRTTALCITNDQNLLLALISYAYAQYTSACIIYSSHKNEACMMSVAPPQWHCVMHSLSSLQIHRRSPPSQLQPNFDRRESSSPKNVQIPNASHISLFTLQCDKVFRGHVLLWWVVVIHTRCVVHSFLLWLNIILQNVATGGSEMFLQKKNVI